MVNKLKKENKCPFCPHSLSNHKLGYCTANNCKCKVERTDIKEWLLARKLKERASRKRGEMKMKDYKGMTEQEIIKEGFTLSGGFAEGCKIYKKDNLRLFLDMNGKVTLAYER